MERDTIRRLLETSARYLGLDIPPCGAASENEAFSPTADFDADDEAASVRVPLACLLRESGGIRSQAPA